MEKRPSIPAGLKRRVLIEAGHRCGIPTCRFPTTEIAHIEPWAKVKEHKYENLIVLCPNCHKMADRGEIDRKSLKIYKRILQRLTDRYYRFELNMLDELREKKQIIIAGNMLLLIKNLLDEGLVEGRIGKDVIREPFREITKSATISASDPVRIEGIPINVVVITTDKGDKFIEEWIKANEKLAY